MIPPGFNIETAQERISRCLAAHTSTCRRLHSPLAGGSLRNIPSPEQGASTTIRSKNNGNRSARRCGVSFKTSALVTPIRSILRESVFALDATISLETSTPLPFIRPAICVLFPPGAPHRSRIISPGSGPSSSTTAMALGS